MGRKRIDLGADADDRIRALLARGASAAEIAVTLRISPATAKRRIRELKGKDPKPGAAFLAKPRPRPPALPPAIAAALPPEADDSSAEIVDADAPPVEFSPETTLQEIDAWLKVAKERAEAAAAADNPKAHAEYMRMIISLIEARRKAAPPPKVDPNDHPDMVAAAEAVRRRWHDLARKLAYVASQPIAERIAILVHEGPEALKAALRSGGGT